MKKKSISELIHFFVRHPLQNSLQMKFWRWLVSPADAEDKEEADIRKMLKHFYLF